MGASGCFWVCAGTAWSWMHPWIPALPFEPLSTTRGVDLPTEFDPVDVEAMASCGDFLLIKSKKHGLYGYRAGIRYVLTPVEVAREPDDELVIVGADPVIVPESFRDLPWEELQALAKRVAPDAPRTSRALCIGAIEAFTSVPVAPEPEAPTAG